MSSREIIEWCKARKSDLHITNDTLATMSGVPVGTVNRIFAGKGADFYYETLRPIIKALVSADWEKDGCPHAEDVPEHSKDTIARLEKEREHLLRENEYLKTNSQKEIAMLLPLLKFRKHAIVVLGTLLGIALAVIIVALIIDRTTPGLGFIWMS